MSKKRTFYMYLLSITLIGCQNINTTSSYQVEDKKVNLSKNLAQNIGKDALFKKKNIQDNDVGSVYYFGNIQTDTNNWTQSKIDDTSNGFISELKKPFTNASYIIDPINFGFDPNNIVQDYIGFSNTTSVNALNGEILRSLGIPDDSGNNRGSKSSGFLFTQAGETINSFDYNDGEPASLENIGTSSNENVLKNLRYNSGTNSNPWSTNIVGGWSSKTLSSGENITYNYNRESKDTSITFEFTGTNVEVYLRNGLDPGWNKVKVSLFSKVDWDEKNFNPNHIPTPIKVLYANSNQTLENSIEKVKINALDMSNYVVKIESDSISRNTSNKESFLYGFDKAIVYPSTQYHFSDGTVAYNFVKANNLGKVSVTIRNDYTGDIVKQEEIDLYNSLLNPIKEWFTFSDDNKHQHTITIESNGTKNSSSSGYGSSVRALVPFPFIYSKRFTGKSATFLVKKGPNYGKSYIYIDGIRKRTVDLYNPTEIYDIEKIDDINFSEHDFSFVAAYDQNVIDNFGRFEVNLDGFGASSAIFGFINTGANNTSNVTYTGVQGSQYGRVTATLLKEPFTDPNPISGTTNLYGTSISANKTLANITFASLEKDKMYYLVVEPDYSNSNGSNNYAINVDEIKLTGYKVDPNTNLTIGTYGNTIDQVCEP